MEKYAALPSGINRSGISIAELLQSKRERQNAAILCTPVKTHIITSF